MNVLIQQILGYASGMLIVLSAVPYIRDIFQKKTKPERMTWFIWTVLLSISFAAQLYAGGTWSLITTGVDLVGVLVIFILSIRNGVGGMAAIDIVALVGSSFALVFWYLTNEPVVAILMSILIDCMATTLTMIKAYKMPGTETVSAYFICGTGGLLGVFAVGKYSLPLMIFPLWICVMNYAIGCVSIAGKRRIARA